MFERIPIRAGCNRWRVAELAGLLLDQMGKELGKGILEQLPSGYIHKDLYAQLSRWVNPDAPRPEVQPIAEAISYELFGTAISRVRP